MILYDFRNPNLDVARRVGPGYILVSDLPSKNNQNIILRVVTVEELEIEVYWHQAPGGARLAMKVDGVRIASVWDDTETSHYDYMHAIVTICIPDGSEYLVTPHQRVLTLEVDGALYDYTLREAAIVSKKSKKVA